MKQLFSLLILLGIGLNISAQNAASPIIFIYDASGSMWAEMQGKTKQEIAITVLSDAINKFPAGQRVGLVAYGHRKKGDCKDVETLVSADNTDKDKIIAALKSIQPLGKTPLAYSATQVINYLRDNKSKATIILVTDGIEVCNGDICAVVTAAKKEGIDFRMHIVGFGLKEHETEQMKCAAKAGNGKYYDASDASRLREVVDKATAVTIDVPIDNYSVYVIKNKKPVDAYIQALIAGTKTPVDQSRTYGDTTFLSLPAGNYDLLVKPMENSDVKRVTIPNISILEGQKGHQTVSFDGGKLSILINNNGEGWDAVISIFSSVDGKKYTGGRSYGKAKVFELNPGIYDIEVKPLVMTGPNTDYRFKNIKVVANETKDISHNFETGIAMLGASSSSGLVDVVFKVKDAATGKGVTSGRTYISATSNPNKIIISPGTYSIVMDGLGDFRGQTRTFNLIVKKGETIEKIAEF